MLNEAKDIFKSIYRMYMSWFVNLASSNVAINTWSCLDILLSPLILLDYRVVLDVFLYRLRGWMSKCLCKVYIWYWLEL